MTFRVVLEPDGGGWHAYVPEVRGCRTWGRSLSEVRRNIREALATCVDVLGKDADRIAREAKLRETPRLPPEAKRELERYAALRKRLEAEEERFRDSTRIAAAALKKTGMSLRDAGDLLGLSHSRVKQITG